MKGDPGDQPRNLPPRRLKKRMAKLIKPERSLKV